MLSGLLRKAKSAFAIDWNNTGESVAGGGIDAVDQSGKRRAPRGNVRSLDDEIPDRKRKNITLTTRNVGRNFEIAAWAIRKHLDFVSRFGFRMNTGIESFDRDVEGFVDWWSRPGNFDVSGRYSLAKSIRLAEACRTVDGDMIFLKISDGRIQAVEGDRIKTPDAYRREGGNYDKERTFNGVETTKAGRPKRYAVHSRKRSGGLKFERWVPRNNVFVHGYFERFDQVRGVSPIVSSLNRFQDVYEGFDYALARAKVSQLFGLVFTRDVEETGLGSVSSTDADEDGVADTSGDNFTVKMGTKPLLLDMNPGEDAKFLENKTPAPEFQQFESMMIGVSLKSLDIPFSFYDEAYTNFFGSKAALTLYLQSVREKREDVKTLLDALTRWRLMLAIEDGEIVVPRSIERIEDIRFSWTPAGIPWFDPRDVRGDIDAIKAGLKTRTEVRQERFGDSWARDVVPTLIEEERIIEENGLNVTMESAPVVAVTNPIVGDGGDEDDSSEESETEE